MTLYLIAGSIIFYRISRSGVTIGHFTVTGANEAGVDVVVMDPVLLSSVEIMLLLC